MPLLMVRESQLLHPLCSKVMRLPILWPMSPCSPSNEIQHLSLTERSRGREDFPDPIAFATH